MDPVAGWPEHFPTAIKRGEREEAFVNYCPLPTPCRQTRRRKEKKTGLLGFPNPPPPSQLSYCKLIAKSDPLLKHHHCVVGI